MYILILNLINFFFLIYFVGLWGLLIIKTNLILILLSIELILFSINLLFCLYSILLNDIQGQVFVLFLLTIAAAESAIGLSILVIYYKVRGLISINLINSLKA